MAKDDKDDQDARVDARGRMAAAQSRAVNPNDEDAAVRAEGEARRAAYLENQRRRNPNR